MQRFLSVLTKLSLCLTLIGMTVHAADKSDPTGTWKWSQTGQNGQTRESTLKLKMDGDKLTGKISGRNSDTDIEDAKIKGDEVSFKVVREFQGNKMTQNYHGKLSGDSIKGKVEFTTRDGEKRDRDWEAKREK
jgi:hypothetical protein